MDKVSGMGKKKFSFFAVLRQQQQQQISFADSAQFIRLTKIILWGRFKSTLYVRLFCSRIHIYIARLTWERVG